MKLSAKQAQPKQIFNSRHSLDKVVKQDENCGNGHLKRVEQCASQPYLSTVLDEEPRIVINESTIGMNTSKSTLQLIDLTPKSQRPILANGFKVFLQQRHDTIDDKQFEEEENESGSMEEVYSDFKRVVKNQRQKETANFVTYQKTPIKEKKEKTFNIVTNDHQFVSQFNNNSSPFNNLSLRKSSINTSYNNAPVLDLRGCNSPFERRSQVRLPDDSGFFIKSNENPILHEVIQEDNNHMESSTYNLVITNDVEGKNTSPNKKAFKKKKAKNKNSIEQESRINMNLTPSQRMSLNTIYAGGRTSQQKVSELNDKSNKEIHQLRFQNAQLRQDKSKLTTKVSSMNKQIDELKLIIKRQEEIRRQDRDYASKLEKEIDRLRALIQTTNTTKNKNY